MRNTKEKNFKLFIKTFEEYQQLFGLTDYEIYFELTPLDGACANITMQEWYKNATVRLDRYHALNDKKEDIKAHARHEAIHLMLSRLQHEAFGRHTSEDSINLSVEGLVRKLEKLIT